MFFCVWVLCWLGVCLCVVCLCVLECVLFVCGGCDCTVGVFVDGGVMFVFVCGG